MLLNRDQIREDKYFGQLTDAILERDQPRTTDLFHEMVRAGRENLDSRISGFSA